MDKEQQVLGACMLNQQALYDAIEILRPNDFSTEINQTIFGDMIKLADNKGVDVVTLCEFSNADSEYIASLPFNVISVSRVKEHALLIKKASNKQQIQNKLSEIYMGVSNLTYEDLTYKIDKELIPLTRDGSHKQETLTDTILGTINDIEKAGKGKSNIIKTGLHDLDNMILGYEKGEVYIIAGRPSMGKTSLALASAVSINKKKKVLLFSLEMDKHQIVKRLLSLKGLIDFQNIRTGNLNEDEWSKVMKASDYISEKQLVIKDDVSNLLGIINNIRKEKPDIVFIDYLQLVSGGSFASKNLEVTYVSRKFKEIAMELKIPVIVVSQLSRATESRADKTPIMSDLRDSGSIEQDATTIMMLYRDVYYNPNSEKSFNKNGNEFDIADVKIVKQRNGETGTVELIYIPKWMKFTDKGREENDRK